MASYSMSCGLSPAEIVDRALNFFGHGRRHLQVSIRGNRCVRFSNHGYVQVSVREGANETIIDLDTSLWDESVRVFMADLAAAPAGARDSVVDGKRTSSNSSQADDRPRQSRPGVMDYRGSQGDGSDGEKFP
jgi:hypothetical protein